MTAMECRNCTYYRDAREARAAFGGQVVAMARCEFTGVQFAGAVERLRGEYPCRRVSYDEYLRRRNPAVSPRAPQEPPRPRGAAALLRQFLRRLFRA